MAISTEASRSTYAGNGATTIFSTGFYFLESSEVVVKHTPSGGSEVILTEGVGYTVTMPASVGAVGSITMAVAPAVGDALVIERTVPFTQETSFRTQGTFDRATHEDAMDEVVFQTQQLARRVSDLESAGAVGSVIAGSGLSFSGDTLHVGAGNGVQVNADTVEVLYGTVSTSVSSGGATSGAANTAARSDHSHSVSVGAALDLVVGATADPGIGTGIALAAHVHGVPAAAPVNVTKAANAEGVAVTFARSDHKHDISTAAAIELTDSTNAEGTATTLARSDHTHAHGVRAGGALHAVATNAVAGFLSAADKASLEAIGAVALKSRVSAIQLASQSIPTDLLVGAVLIDWAESIDADGEFDPSTGVYTAKAAGTLLVAVQLSVTSAAWTAGEQIEFGARKNGTYIQNVPTRAYFDTGVTRAALVEQVRFTTVSIGDTIDVFVAHDQGASVNMRGILHIQRAI